jgi:hypothetical protein
LPVDPAPTVPFEQERERRLIALRTPFPKEQIGKLPATQKRPELDFVGHAAVTDRLNTVLGMDWSYTVDELFSIGETVWIRGTMTVLGCSRVEYGDGDDAKEAIGNFIRRAAMRFGVAIDLWSRQELGTASSAYRSQESPGKGSTRSEGSTGMEAAGAAPETAGGSGDADPAPLLNPVVIEAMEDLSDLWTEALKVGLTERKALAVATTRGLGVKSAAELDVPQMREVLIHWGEMQRKKAKR